MVKLSDIELPVIFKKQLLFKAGNWNRWNISPQEVNDSVKNTNWNKINSSLLYSHKDSDFGLDENGKIVKKDWADAWAGNVQNIHTDGMGSVYGDIHVYDPNAAVALKFGNAPLAVSAGIAWPEEYDQPTHFFYRNFNIVADPGIRDRNIFFNFSAQDKPIEGFKIANFSAVIDSTSASGSAIEQHMNSKDTRGEKKMNCEKCKDGKCSCDMANYENKEIQPIKDSEQTKEMIAQVIEQKEYSMENMAKDESTPKEEKEHNYSNINERGLKDTITQKNIQPSMEDRIDAIEARIAHFENIQTETKANFAEGTVEKLADSLTNTTPSPVVPTEAPKVESTVPPIVPANTVSAAPAMDSVMVDALVTKIAEKLTPALMKPAPMTTQEFGGTVRDDREAIVEKLADKLSKL